MTQVFRDDGKVVPVTLVKAEPNTVTQIRTTERDGYVGVQLGTDVKKRLNKAQTGHVKELPQTATLREFRVNETELNRGDQVAVTAFEPGTKVNVTGVSKGRGFAGVVKRHGFKGQSATHGNKDQLRMPGSIGSQMQGPVMPGKRMPGHMGAEQVTVKNLEIVHVDEHNHTLAVKGAIPGAPGSLVLIRSTEGNVWRA